MSTFASMLVPLTFGQAKCWRFRIRNMEDEIKMVPPVRAAFFVDFTTCYRVDQSFFSSEWLWY